jgi:hypothetical protein
MTRWRYQTVIAKPVVMEHECYAFSIDGDTEAPIIGKRGILAERMLLPDYLASVGEEGWEVCGISPISGHNGSIPVLIVLKKPTKDE